MSRLATIVFFLLIVFFLGFLVIKNTIKNTPVFLPAFTPPQEDIRTSFKNIGQLKFPLSVPPGFSIGIYAGLKGDMPRVLAFDPNGVLTASITGSGKVLALPGKGGQAERIVTILSGLNKPHGIAFNAGFLYVAETDKVTRYSYNPQDFTATNKQVLFSLPSGGRHFTRTIKIIGDKLYTSVGSSCDVCVENDSNRAGVLVSDLDGKNLRVFAKGLRNTVFFTFDGKGRIWGNDMGRDFLGDSLPPDELNIISEGKDYGWPYCYGDKVRDTKFQNGQQPDYCKDTQGPVFKYPAHVAPLGITFDGQGNIFASFHGSWNSSVPVGYKVVKLTLSGDNIVKSEDYVTGWLKGQEVLGRPVDLIFDKNGNLYISDDKAGLIYVLFKS